MAKVTALTEVSAPTTDDLVYLVDDPAGTPASYKLSLTRLGGLLVRNAVGGRLTLTSGTPITTADVTGATSVYFTPYSGSLFAGLISLYDGTRWRLYAFTQLTLALGTLTASLPYDVYLYDNAGTLTLEALAWTNGTTRATALATQDGIYVKTGALTRRYLGTFYTTATTTTEDSAAKRFLWNYYNRVPRILTRTETAASWTQSAATIRQANTSTANQVEGVVGVAEVTIDLLLNASYRNSAAGASSWGQVGIGEDSTTAYDSLSTRPWSYSWVAGANGDHSLVGRFVKTPAAGYHKWTWLENTGGGGPIATWTANDGANLVGTLPG